MPAGSAASAAVCVGDSESSDVAEVVDLVDSEDGGWAAEVKVPSGAPPVRFQGYCRGRELGRGSSGQVFVCKRAGCANGFAVKAVNLKRMRLHPNVEREWQKLCREVKILRKLPPHPNIVQLVDTFEEGNWFMMVLELVGGGDLFTTLTSRAKSRLLEGEARFVLAQLTEGLGFLHDQRVIHRDMKLENILVSSQRKQRPSGLVLYSVKITDFGLSKYIGLGNSEAQSTVGSRPYTAPEVLQEGSHDFSSDLWCLGVLLYVLLVGHFPFDQVPEQQDDLDRIIEGCTGSEASKSILIGLLQMEPSQRLSLAAVRCHNWLQDLDGLDGLEQPQKRPRVATQASGAPETNALQVPGIFLEVCPVSPTRQEDGAIDVIEDALVDISVDESLDGAMGIASVGHTSRGIASITSVGGIASVGPATTGIASPGGLVSPLAEDGGIASLGSLRGAWTPFAVEASLQLTEVRRPSPSPDVMQVHVVIPDRLAGFILGKQGARIQEMASDSGCQVWMTSRDGDKDRRVVIIGNYKQCKIAQEFVHEQLAIARKSDWRDTEAEVVLFVRVEAAGVVTGKGGFVLKQMRKQSGAQIQLLREEVEGQRPCVITGMLQNVLRAEKHVFNLVRAVPAQPDSGSADDTSPGVGAPPRPIEERTVVIEGRTVVGTAL